MLCTIIPRKVDRGTKILGVAASEGDVMKINIALDSKLIAEALRFASVKTKRELVELALHEFIKNHRCLDVRKLLGKVKIHDDYDYKVLRKDIDKGEA